MRTPSCIETPASHTYPSEASHHYVFISHYKAEAGSTAALMQDMLMRMLKEKPDEDVSSNMEAPVFLDSEDLIGKRCGRLRQCLLEGDPGDRLGAVDSPERGWLGVRRQDGRSELGIRRTLVPRGPRWGGAPCAFPRSFLRATPVVQRRTCAQQASVSLLHVARRGPVRESSAIGLARLKRAVLIPGLCLALVPAVVESWRRGSPALVLRAGSRICAGVFHRPHPGALASRSGANFGTFRSGRKTAPRPPPTGLQGPGGTPSIVPKDLKDLSDLKRHVAMSHNLVLLLTRGVLTRPWCLLEIVTATKAGAQVLPVKVDEPGEGFEFPDDAFYERLQSGRVPLGVASGSDRGRHRAGEGGGGSSLFMHQAGAPRAALGIVPMRRASGARDAREARATPRQHAPRVTAPRVPNRCLRVFVLITMRSRPDIPVEHWVLILVSCTWQSGPLPRHPQSIIDFVVGVRIYSLEVASSSPHPSVVSGSPFSTGPLLASSPAALPLPQCRLRSGAGPRPSRAES